jgi:hypothetical protein
MHVQSVAKTNPAEAGFVFYSLPTQTILSPHGQRISDIRFGDVIYPKVAAIYRPCLIRIGCIGSRSPIVIRNNESIENRWHGNRAIAALCLTIKIIRLRECWCPIRQAQHLLPVWHPPLSCSRSVRQTTLPTCQSVDRR